MNGLRRAGLAALAALGWLVVAGGGSALGAEQREAGAWLRLSEPTELRGGKELVGHLPQGMILRAEREQGGWFWVEAEGKKGWVRSHQVQRAKDLAPGVVGFRLGLFLKPLAEPVTSKAGGHFAYVVEGQRGVCVVLDGQPGPEFDAIVGGTLRAVDLIR